MGIFSMLVLGEKSTFQHNILIDSVLSEKNQH
jgi:hypothetical protein